MKVVILAGGFGTRISEESVNRPKPMIEIGGMPILWHIMKSYSAHGFHEFVICCGYKQHIIKDFFANYFLHTSDVTFDFADNNAIEIHCKHAEPWKVSVVDTGLNTMTGGRIKRVKDYIGGETFMMTYGDGVCDIDMNKLLDYHRANGKLATLTAINVGQRFGVLGLGEDGRIEEFREKDSMDESVINGGYMVLEPQVLDYIEGDATVFEKAPLERLAAEGQLMAYKHDGFWKCMDTQRDYMELQGMWEDGTAKWKQW
ncbi:glucose-1-phosphate cytidylyltransferase [Oscillibacter sp.]|uniref:glucose-1-phosphate cytidylyltransferase n=1 Tax=Oscillibacter sp. TaxID=1945593 RepID=UPI00289E4A2B|nr:glucose-1-phosphate cytidylyltransferase [Oscillibacter sp.]